MARVIFVLLDGCGYDLARECCGFLEHMAESGQAAKYRVCGHLPSMSRPLYATLLTGLPVHRHGVGNNMMSARLEADSVFSLCTAENRTTAAAAYCWMSELFQYGPFDYARHRYQLQGEGVIQHGLYYFEDNYPDSHLFLDAEFLRRSFAPDFLVAHSMNIDHAGHVHGTGSMERSLAAIKADAVLASLVPLWRADGAYVAITADHGAGAHGLHGGNTPEQRMVPLYLLGPDIRKGVFDEQEIDQLWIAPLLCRMLGIAPGREMRKPEVDFYDE
ncbi:MAG: alkaline phosphatase family protein [Candidatus Limiplasma sp.]|nr:alkaline phosphatase family protein [Candidatus Limiplasma sp.]